MIAPLFLALSERDSETNIRHQGNGVTVIPLNCKCINVLKSLFSPFLREAKHVRKSAKKIFS